MLDDVREAVLSGRFKARAGADREEEFDAMQVVQRDDLDTQPVFERLPHGGDAEVAHNQTGSAPLVAARRADAEPAAAEGLVAELIHDAAEDFGFLRDPDLFD